MRAKQELASLQPKVIPPVSVKLVSYTAEGPLLVAATARITVSKKDFEKASKMSREEIEQWIKELITRGHGSPLEHSSYTFEAVCSRVCSHQLVRHRHASYTQHSMRWSEGFLREAALEACKYTGATCAIKPKKTQDYENYANVLEDFYRTADPYTLVYVASRAFSLPPPYTKNRLHILAEYARLLIASIARYYRLIALGERKEDARLIIPQSVKTRILFTMNARELLEVFLPLRMCTRAQWEIRILAWSIRTLLVQLHPEIFKWAGPRCVLLENRARKAPCPLEDYLKGFCSFTIDKCPEKTPRKGIMQCLLYAATSKNSLA